MPTLPPKICPGCGDEYLHTAQRCAACDLDLVLEAPEAEREDEAPEAALPDCDALAPLVRGGPWELERIAQALSEAGIPSRIESHPPRGRGEGSGSPRGSAGFGLHLCVYVLPEQRGEALVALERFQAANLPDAPAPAPGDAPPDADGCPACGASLEGAVTDCPDCGLPFPAAVYTCRCGAEVSADQEACSVCGEALSEGGAD